jgi:hypothetical protein
MRLTAEQIRGIRRIARQLAGDQAEIRVFGSGDAVFAGFTITREDQRVAYAECRLQTLGL